MFYERNIGMKPGNKIVLGILAHVDAGKTTLAESIMYLTGRIRRLGRVDHQNAFLDTYALERARGITIFSKQAEFALPHKEVTLLDTPGHVDFSAEMERTLQVLDYAVLVISGADGVQGHVETLWRLLSRYEIPVFLFVNKMDQPGTDKETLLAELKSRLDGNCVDFSDAEKSTEAFFENIAVCEEELLEYFLEKGELEKGQIAQAIQKRRIFPVFFGSALKVEGVEELLRGLDTFSTVPSYSQEFGARVFKISRDEQGKRLTYMKVTGGMLKVKQLLNNAGLADSDSQEYWEEKADQLRVYSGSSFTPVQEMAAGGICAVTGLTKTFAGQGLGWETESVLPVLEPVLTYRIILPEDCDVHQMLLKLRALEEEEPQLHIVWEEESGEIHAQVMGEVQIEILKSQIAERYGVSVEFGSGSIVYKETITAPVEGVGHYEPLRHYAEVHLWMEPAESGSGLQFAVGVSEDELDKNWQRLVLTHLEEKKHVGVLTRSEITDMKITLVGGRAHLKHTEGGDFRQSTYRAIRQGLMSTQSQLLEPVYAFRLELPTENVGRAMTDIQKMQGSFEPPMMEGDMSVLTGSAPVVTMRGYQTELTAYTKGRGRIFCTLKGYEPCHNEEEVIAARAYDPEADLENSPDSVFCAHGAGFVVPWYEVPDYMHVETPYSRPKPVREEETEAAVRTYELPEGISQEELDEIFARTYGQNKREKHGYEKKRYAGKQSTAKTVGIGTVSASRATVNGPRVLGTDTGVQKTPGAFGTEKSRLQGAYSKEEKKKAVQEYLLVDGYNIIFAWEELKELAQINIESARDKLMDILCNYQGFRQCVLILVFDAYRVPGNPGSVMKYHNIDVVYTKEAETADQYIEKTAHELGRQHHVTVATSDALEQVIIFGQGARRLSARELKEEVECTRREILETWEVRRQSGKNYLFNHMDEETAAMMEEVRLGKREL